MRYKVSPSLILVEVVITFRVSHVVLLSAVLTLLEPIERSKSEVLVAVRNVMILFGVLTLLSRTRKA